MSLSKRPMRRALYLQVRDAMAECIASGVWKPGASIANENDLARDFGVSSGTVRKALKIMEAQRLVHRRQGRGTFVNDQSSAQLMARFCTFHGPDGARVFGKVALVEVREATANDGERRLLQLGEGDPVFRISRVHTHNERPFLVEEATVPEALFPGLAARPEMAASIVTLAAGFGVLLGNARDHVSIALPTAGASKALDVASGTPLLRRERIVFLLNGTPAEWVVAQCHLVGGHYRADIN